MGRLESGGDEGLAFIGIAGFVAALQRIGEVELGLRGPVHGTRGLVGLHPGAEVVNGEVETIHGCGELAEALLE
ncbi:MAG: hypothetical protein IPQ14_02745 [Candidatus Microthrix sp.]|uniref:hypothetical protein n=1 Tax=Candidatus Neomicrothrix sp. TaxID=2719034 RepID=UPI002A76DAF6|nr:hypothetical protein [Candidatus Microthrix sp.]